MNMALRLNLNHFVRVLLIVGLVAAVNSHSQESTPDPFPMQEGTICVYRGVVGWYDMKARKTVGATVTSRSEVVRVIRRNKMVAALLKGFPADFEWSEGQALLGDWLIVRTGKDEVYLLGAEEVERKLKRLENPDDSLEGMLTVDDLLMKFPAKKGMKFCDAESRSRTDDHYCWVVTSTREADLSDVRGLKPGKHTSFLLQFVTNPDDTEFEFVPGIGFISYRYHHHGTVADTEMSLVEYHSANNTQSMSGAKR